MATQHQSPVIHLENLSLQLKTILLEILRKEGAQFSIPFIKVRKNGRSITSLSFSYWANWPEAKYEDLHQALLALHRTGLILYGPNFLRLMK